TARDCANGWVWMIPAVIPMGDTTGRAMALLNANPSHSLSLAIILVFFIGIQWAVIFSAAFLVAAIIADKLEQQF
ncbi:MAG: hypothetical protein ACU84Q_21565, partial [Gammaproteobacteria bacterium]